MPIFDSAPIMELEIDFYTQRDEMAHYRNLSPEEKERWDCLVETIIYFRDNKTKGYTRILAEGYTMGYAKASANGYPESYVKDLALYFAMGYVHGVCRRAKNLKQMGVSVDIITQSTGLSAEEVEKL